MQAAAAERKRTRGAPHATDGSAENLTAQAGGQDLCEPYHEEEEGRGLLDRARCGSEQEGVVPTCFASDVNGVTPRSNRRHYRAEATPCPGRRGSGSPLRRS